MKDKASNGKIAIAFFVLIFAAFLGYQISRNLGEKITTVDATFVTVKEKQTLEAVFIRSQQYVTCPGDTPEYLVSNGEKVSVNQELCITFLNEEASETFLKMQEVMDEIEAEKYTNAIVISASDTAKLDRIIYDKIKDLADEINTGSVDETDKSYSALFTLVDARNSGVYDPNEVNQKIADLEEEALRYKKELSKSSNIVTSTVSGYFVKGADGYENVFCPEAIDTLTLYELQKKKASPETVTKNIVGSIVDEFCWYMAIEADYDQTAFFTRMRDKGEAVDIYISGVSSYPESFMIHRINRDDSGRSVVILKSNVMSGEYLTARSKTVEIIVNTYKGIKIPHEALHQKDGEWGVYCMDGSSVKFKKADIIYETDGYYLLEMADSAQKGVYIYDKIVLGGVNID